MAKKGQDAGGVIVPPIEEETLEQMAQGATGGFRNEFADEPDPGKQAAVAGIDPATEAGLGGHGAGLAGALQYAPLPVAMPSFVTQEMFIAAMETLQSKFSEQIASELKTAMDTLKSTAADQQNGITAQVVGGFFDCPKCGLRIQGPSMTSQKGGTYEHPFSESQKLGMKQCELKGVKFKAPVMFLEFLKPLTGTTK